MKIPDYDDYEILVDKGRMTETGLYGSPSALENFDSDSARTGIGIRIDEQGNLAGTYSFERHDDNTKTERDHDGKFIVHETHDGRRFEYNLGDEKKIETVEVYSRKGVLMEKTTASYTADENGREILAEHRTSKGDILVSAETKYGNNDNIESYTSRNASGDTIARTSYEYNQLGQLESVTRYDGNDKVTEKYEYKYSSSDNLLVCEVFKNGELDHTTKTGRDIEGNTTTTYYDPDGAVTSQVTFDANGNKDEPNTEYKDILQKHEGISAKIEAFVANLESNGYDKEKIIEVIVNDYNDFTEPGGPTDKSVSFAIEQYEQAPNLFVESSNVLACESFANDLTKDMKDGPGKDKIKLDVENIAKESIENHKVDENGNIDKQALKEDMYTKLEKVVPDNIKPGLEDAVNSLVNEVKSGKATNDGSDSTTRNDVDGKTEPEEKGKDTDSDKKEPKDPKLERYELAKEKYDEARKTWSKGSMVVAIARCELDIAAKACGKEGSVKDKVPNAIDIIGSIYSITRANIFELALEAIARGIYAGVCAGNEKIKEYCADKAVSDKVSDIVGKTIDAHEAYADGTIDKDKIRGELTDALKEAFPGKSAGEIESAVNKAVDRLENSGSASQGVSKEDLQAAKGDIVASVSNGFKSGSKDGVEGQQDPATTSDNKKIAGGLIEKLSEAVSTKGMYVREANNSAAEIKRYEITLQDPDCKRVVIKDDKVVLNDDGTAKTHNLKAVFVADKMTGSVNVILPDGAVVNIIGDTIKGVPCKDWDKLTDGQKSQIVSKLESASGKEWAGKIENMFGSEISAPYKEAIRDIDAKIGRLDTFAKDNGYEGNTEITATRKELVALKEGMESKGFAPVMERVSLCVTGRTEESIEKKLETIEARVSEVTRPETKESIEARGMLRSAISGIETKIENSSVTAGLTKDEKDAVTGTIFESVATFRPNDDGTYDKEKLKETIAVNIEDAAPGRIDGAELRRKIGVAISEANLPERTTVDSADAIDKKDLDSKAEGIAKSIAEELRVSKEDIKPAVEAVIEKLGTDKDGNVSKEEFGRELAAEIKDRLSADVAAPEAIEKAAGNAMEKEGLKDPVTADKKDAADSEQAQKEKIESVKGSITNDLTEGMTDNDAKKGEIKDAVGKAVDDAYAEQKADNGAGKDIDERIADKLKESLPDIGVNVEPGKIEGVCANAVESAEAKNADPAANDTPDVVSKADLEASKGSVAESISGKLTAGLDEDKKEAVSNEIAKIVGDTIDAHEPNADGSIDKDKFSDELTGRLNDAVADGTLPEELKPEDVKTAVEGVISELGHEEAAPESGDIAVPESESMTDGVAKKESKNEDDLKVAVVGAPQVDGQQEKADSEGVVDSDESEQLEKGTDEKTDDINVDPSVALAEAKTDIDKVLCKIDDADANGLQEIIDSGEYLDALESLIDAYEKIADKSNEDINLGHYLEAAVDLYGSYEATQDEKPDGYMSDEAIADAYADFFGSRENESETNVIPDLEALWASSASFEGTSESLVDAPSHNDLDGGTSPQNTVADINDSTTSDSLTYPVETTPAGNLDITDKITDRLSAMFEASSGEMPVVDANDNGSNILDKQGEVGAAAKQLDIFNVPEHQNTDFNVPQPSSNTEVPQAPVNDADGREDNLRQMIANALDNNISKVDAGPRAPDFKQDVEKPAAMADR